MKKFLSIILATAMIMGVFSMTAVYAENEPAPVFTLDFSGYDGTNVSGLKNSVSGSASTFAVGTSGNAFPAVRTDCTPNGINKYIQFSEDDTGSSLGGIAITDATLTALDTMTFETWVRFTSLDTGSQHLVSFNSNRDKHTFQIQQSVQVKVDGVVDPTQFKIYVKPWGDNYTVWTTSLEKTITNNEWHHLVVTRTDTEAVFYIDGTEAGRKTHTTAVTKTYTPSLIQLGCAKWGNYMKGGMGALNIYNSVLTGEQVAKLYADSAAKYTCQAVTYKDADGNAISEEMPDGDTEVSARFAYKNTTSSAVAPLVILGYFEDGKLINAKVADEVSVAAGKIGVINADVDEITTKPTGQVKLFVWDSFDSMKPILDGDYLTVPYQQSL
ncbi:MAG: LamG domain-containing protein [Clostridia bacterium]|nr:LamG domain-containing protein [Clostridia bacterium]